MERKVKLTNSDRQEAERFQERLTNLDGEFRTYHLAVVDLLEEDDLEKEQADLDDHDDRVTYRFDRLACLTTPEEQEKRLKPDPRLCLQWRLQHLEGNLRKISKAVASVADKVELDRCLIEQYDEQLNGFKLELYDISPSIQSMEGDVSELSDHEV